MTSSPVQDPVPVDTPGAAEIGYAKPEWYNASALLFDNLAADRGSNTAVRSTSGNMTYAALCAQASRVGNALLSLGCAPGDRVLLFLDDTPAYPAAVFGAMRAGLVPVLLNTQSTADLVRYYIEDSGARAAMADAAQTGLFACDVVTGTNLDVLVSVNGTPDETVQIDCRDGDQWFQEFPPELAAYDTHADDMAFWMYSSGSTGRPKGVVHLHHDMAYTVASYARHVLKITEDDTCFSVPKIFFAYGFGNSISFPFAVGAATVLLDGRPTPDRVYSAIAAHRPTIFFGLPTLYTALIKDASARTAELDSVRLCISAAEVLSADIFGAWRDRFGLEIVEGLGSTEVLHIYLSNSEAEKKSRWPPAGVCRDTRSSWSTVTALLWAGTKRASCVCAASRMRRATGTGRTRPQRPCGTAGSGTGDRFHVDEDGFYFFRGRADDLIKVSGQWVYPLEIELCLAEHPQVRECAVLGIELPDRRMTTKAYVVLDNGRGPGDAMTRDLQDFAKQHLVPYKYPRVVEYFAELPKTGTGKIDRQALLNGEAEHDG